jgi:hypothetical protein
MARRTTEEGTDKKVIDGVECVMIEPDIDLHKELIAHGFCEVFPNLLSGGKTDPCAVYSMRWALANDEGGPVFNPGYALA